MNRRNMKFLLPTEFEFRNEMLARPHIRYVEKAPYSRKLFFLWLINLHLESKSISDILWIFMLKILENFAAV